VCKGQKRLYQPQFPSFSTIVQFLTIKVTLFEFSIRIPLAIGDSVASIVIFSIILTTVLEFMAVVIVLSKIL